MHTLTLAGPDLSLVALALTHSCQLRASRSIVDWNDIIRAEELLDRVEAPFQNKMSRTWRGYATASGPDGIGLVAILTEDFRARVDYHGDLEELKLFQTYWKDPKNPWAGGQLIGLELHGYSLAYS